MLSWARVEELWDTRQGEAWSTGGRYSAMREAAARWHVPVVGPERLCRPARPFHGVTLTVIAPCPRVDPTLPPNDASFVIRLDFGAASVLLPGDLERGGEVRVGARLGPVTLLKLGHHGSRTSSTEAFLDRVRPRIAIASAGHPSPFDHPHNEVLERFYSRRIPLWTTAAWGAVMATLRRDGSFEIGPAEW